MPEITNIAALLLGSNRGDRLDNILQASVHIKEKTGTIVKKSSVYETAPWGNTNQDNFLNRALLVRTQLSPKNLLDQLLEIEKQLGRERKEKWGPRTIDIDILYYNEDIVYDHDIKIPHPFLQDRRFSLVALNEISPDWKHPLFRKTVRTMLDECPDTNWVKLYKGDKEAQ